MDIANILLDLEIIKQIKENDKLGIIIVPGSKNLYVDTYSKISSLKRWYNGNNRENTIKYIEDLVERIDKITNILKNGNYSNLCNTLKKAIDNSIGGLNNLKMTYNDDSLVYAQLVLVINKLSSIANILENMIVNTIDDDTSDLLNNMSNLENENI